MASRGVLVLVLLVPVFVAAAYASLLLGSWILGLVFAALVPLTAIAALFAWVQSSPRRRR